MMMKDCAAAIQETRRESRYLSLFRRLADDDDQRLACANGRRAATGYRAVAASAISVLYRRDDGAAASEMPRRELPLATPHDMRLERVDAGA